MVCKECHNFKTFGKDCWFYWDEKKKCSQFKRSVEDNPDYKSVE
jgi:hypothetical protein